MKQTVYEDGAQWDLFHTSVFPKSRRKKKHLKNVSNGVHIWQIPKSAIRDMNANISVLVCIYFVSNFSASNETYFKLF